MASVIERKGKHKSSWQAHIRPAQGKAITKTFSTEEKAWAFANSLASAIKASNIQVKKRSAGAQGYSQFLNEKVADIFSLFLNDPVAPAKFYEQQTPTVLRHIGDVTVGEIDLQWTKAFIKSMRRATTFKGEPYKYESIQKYMSMIGRVCRWRADDLPKPDAIDYGLREVLVDHALDASLFVCIKSRGLGDVPEGGEHLALADGRLH